MSNGNVLQVKLEYKNAMGSNHYARYWGPYLFIAETLGLIDPGNDEILEITSGSSGIALSKICDILGYNLSIIVPKSISQPRLKAMENKNTNIIITNGYIDACIEKMKEIRDEDKFRYFLANHAEEKANIITHSFARIATEVIKSCNFPDYAIVAIGNGTSAEAIANVFQSHPINKRCGFIAYHPDFLVANTKPVLGLLPPNVKFRHVDNIKNKLDQIEFTNFHNILEIRRQFQYDNEVQNFGHTSLYGLAVALKLSKKVENKIFFSVAYDTFEMYD